ncbi:MAG: MSHA pilin protein MshC [Porticoccus sp.]|jgi:MSHA pilin protein MshC
MLLFIHRKPNQRGFTQLELVMVVVIMGVLAVFIAPSFNNNGSGSYGNIFYARGFHDETLALLRFGQKSAIAQRRTVCVVFSGRVSVSLRIAANAATPTCNTDLQGPKGDTTPGGTVTAKGDAVFSVIPESFNFDGLGQPVDVLSTLVGSQTIQVVNAAKAITVEAVTGYVHD